MMAPQDATQACMGTEGNVKVVFEESNVMMRLMSRLNALERAAWQVMRSLAFQQNNRANLQRPLC